MRYGKLHLVVGFLGYGSGSVGVATACKMTAFASGGLDWSRNEGLDFTNDISVMEYLPRAKVCQNCMKSYRAQHGKGGA